MPRFGVTLALCIYTVVAFGNAGVIFAGNHFYLLALDSNLANTSRSNIFATFRNPSCAGVAITNPGTSLPMLAKQLWKYWKYPTIETMFLHGFSMYVLCQAQQTILNQREPGETREKAPLLSTPARWLTGWLQKPGKTNVV